MAGSLNERFSRMSPVKRGLVLFTAITLALLMLGFWIGFVAASVEHGHLLPRKPAGWIIVAIGALITFGVVRLIRALFKSGLFAGMTRFDTRYWKMWLGVMLLGIPIGIGLVVLGLIDMPGQDLDRLFGTGTIGSVTAIIATAAFIIILVVAFWLYQRAIDDHEEQAYLWGSQIAYYFVVLAIPAWWLLSRGGIVPPLDFAAAFSIVVISSFVQGAVWAWFKFR